MLIFVLYYLFAMHVQCKCIFYFNSEKEYHWCFKKYLKYLINYILEKISGKGEYIV